ncbi:hypothetical protein M409DRAFT_50141 [Zasmidium cellare ATCC 36951]|uniref:Calcineurin-like phosphoesterase domain-containing protein n=1 Tax=Zasmidium cellare ATCC 36951 TaxID=1080233 RepID=A0A6A6D2P1_ZASCE|nr:uncharacterized protein M409DRAFT_50141 [Zasmidium cellare ATCC 36951]KAF2172442.1 hypothetical protein M409DRAFT_50141 [Zasmidium cellare ATCC 36951]
MSKVKVRIICVSDTHNHSPREGYKLPKGDVLIHAGDFTNQGSLAEVKKAVDWISKADFEAKVIVADPDYALKHKSGWGVVPADVEACRNLVVANDNFVYLQHASAVIPLPSKSTHLRIFGSPYSPDRGRQNWAFQYEENAAESIWNAVPEEVDILVTHTPPRGLLDASKHWEEGGCPALKSALLRVRPLVHVFGHCHEGRGATVVQHINRSDNPTPSITWDDPGSQSNKQSLLNLSRKGLDLRSGEQTALVNASIMATSFHRGSKAFNKPVVVDIEIPLRDARTASGNAEAAGVE